MAENGPRPFARSHIEYGICGISEMNGRNSLTVGASPYLLSPTSSMSTIRRKQLAKQVCRENNVDSSSLKITRNHFATARRSWRFCGR
uniref:Uncharacterized protein n=1 Tax=Bursaphelenchus xylophilus TaxID=6326 RepID=A0A1I7RTN6_BURXY